MGRRPRKLGRRQENWAVAQENWAVVQENWAVVQENWAVVRNIRADVLVDVRAVRAAVREVSAVLVKLGPCQKYGKFVIVRSIRADVT